MTEFERACRGYGMDNQRMLVIVFMCLEAKAAKDFKEVKRVGEYSDSEGFKHQLGEKCGKGAVWYQDAVTELKKGDMRNGSRYYANVVKIVDRFFKETQWAQGTALISAFFWQFLTCL